jgi:hypothetical protein
MTFTHHHAQLFSVEMGSPKLFCLVWSRNVILSISASHVANVVGMHNCAQLLTDMGSLELLAWTGLCAPDLTLPSSLDYRYEPLAPGQYHSFAPAKFSSACFVNLLHTWLALTR